MSYASNYINDKKESTYTILRRLRRLLRDNNFQEFVGQFNDKRKVSLWLSPALVDIFRIILRLENPSNPKSVSQAIHEYMLDYIKNYILNGGQNQIKLTQFIIAQPHSQILIQNKVEQTSKKCYFCGNIAVATAVFAPTNRQYPVCSKHAEELKNHPKWRLLDEGV